MIISNLHSEFTIIAARERLCAHAKILGSPCHRSVLPAVYRAVLAHSVANHHPRPPPDHSQDAILYVTVVIIFYSAIILLLVGTNLLRRRSRKRTPSTQIVVYDQRRGNFAHRIADPDKSHLLPVRGITHV